MYGTTNRPGLSRSYSPGHRRPLASTRPRSAVNRRQLKDIGQSVVCHTPAEGCRPPLLSYFTYLLTLLFLTHSLSLSLSLSQDPSPVFFLSLFLSHAPSPVLPPPPSLLQTLSRAISVSFPLIATSSLSFAHTPSLSFYRTLPVLCPLSLALSLSFSISLSLSVSTPLCLTLPLMRARSL